MTEKMKTTAPLSSVGADGAQPQLKNHSEIIANETAQINLQALEFPQNYPYEINLLRFVIHNF